MSVFALLLWCLLLLNCLLPSLSSVFLVAIFIVVVLDLFMVVALSCCFRCSWLVGSLVCCGFVAVCWCL